MASTTKVGRPGTRQFAAPSLAIKGPVTKYALAVAWSRSPRRRKKVCLSVHDGPDPRWNEARGGGSRSPREMACPDLGAFLGASLRFVCVFFVQLFSPHISRFTSFACGFVQESLASSRLITIWVNREMCPLPASAAPLVFRHPAGRRHRNFKLLDSHLRRVWAPAGRQEQQGSAAGALREVGQHPVGHRDSRLSPHSGAISLHEGSQAPSHRH